MVVKIDQPLMEIDQPQVETYYGEGREITLLWIVKIDQPLVEIDQPLVETYHGEGREKYTVWVMQVDCSHGGDRPAPGGNLLW